MVANGDVADFIAQDDVQNRHRLQRIRRADLAQLGLDLRRGVQAAGLQRARHQGHARHHIVGRLVAHLPQAVVRGEVAVVPARHKFAGRVGRLVHAAQMRAQQRKVMRLFLGHQRPVGVKRVGHAVKAPDRIERQVDRVELNVADRMDHRRTAFQRGGRAARHLGRVCQFGVGRTAGQLQIGRIIA